MMADEVEIAQGEQLLQLYKRRKRPLRTYGRQSAATSPSPAIPLTLSSSLVAGDAESSLPSPPPKRRRTEQQQQQQQQQPPCRREEEEAHRAEASASPPSLATTATPEPPIQKKPQPKPPLLLLQAHKPNHQPKRGTIMSYFQPTARPTSTRCSIGSSTTSPVPEIILDTIVVGGGAYSEEYTPTPPSSPPPPPLEPEHAELETEMKNTGEHDNEEEEEEEEEEEDGDHNSDSDERQKQAAAGKRTQQPKKKKRQKKEMVQMTLNVSRTTDPGFTLCKDCGILYNHLNQKDRQEHSRRHAAWVRRNNKKQT